MQKLVEMGRVANGYPHLGIYVNISLIKFLLVMTFLFIVQRRSSTSNQMHML